MAGSGGRRRSASRFCLGFGGPVVGEGFHLVEDALEPDAVVADIRECARVCRQEEPDPALEFIEYVQPVTDADTKAVLDDELETLLAATGADARERYLISSTCRGCTCPQSPVTVTVTALSAATPTAGSEPQDLCLLGGEFLLGENALVLEAGQLLEHFDLLAVHGWRCGGFGCHGFILWSRGRRGILGLGLRGAPLRRLGSHVGCGSGHHRGGRYSGNGSTSSQRHVNRLLLFGAVGGGLFGANDVGFADLSRQRRPRRPLPLR